jgi:phosphatidylserine/phosphatidylglycerophosphate/cardiolipin synthase-like enzyme
VQHDDWFLTATQRRNPNTRLDSRHGTGDAWSEGNLVTPLVHGFAYFDALLRCVASLTDGDVLLFTDWRGDPDQMLADGGPTVSAALCAAAARGVVVNGLVWRSHLDKLAFSATENRHLGKDIEESGGCCLLDMRVRPGGSHHQKFLVVRRARDRAADIAFVGGIDLCHGRRDDGAHGGDVQGQPMAAVYGARPPWHDIHLALRGPAVGDVDTVFRERWNDPAPLSRAPWRRLANRLRAGGVQARPLPPRQPDPPVCGTHAVQLLRTYPHRRHPYPFAPDGERSVALGYSKALGRARSLVFVEDQYLWSTSVCRVFATALQRNQGLRMVAVVPRFPDEDGRLSKPPNDVGRTEGLRILKAAGGDRVAVFDIQSKDGTPIYVHAKVCVIDDVWAAVGSANLNRRSWTHDSELTCAVVDDEHDPREPLDPGGVGDGARRFARELRLELAREHLGRSLHGPVDDLIDPQRFFDAFGVSAAALDRWYAAGQQGDRPAGQLRRHETVAPRGFRAAWATLLYRTVYDPDARSPLQRWRHRF